MSKEPTRSSGSQGPTPGGSGIGPGAIGLLTEKPQAFAPTVKRILKELGRDRLVLAIASLLSILSVVASVAGPKVMALATNALSKGILAKMKGVPGASVDFAYIGKVALALIALYVASAVMSYAQQVITVKMTQRFVFKLRNEVSRKLDRLPLAFFDKQTHGEILSKITLDIDLISTNLQQVLAQSLTSVFMLIGIVIMMFSISWQLALVSLIAIPLTLGVTMLIAPRSQKYFRSQQRIIGELNGQIEENYSGHLIVKSFNLEGPSIKRFVSKNDDLFESAWKAQFMTSVIMPLIMFISNIQYVVIVVIAAIMSANGRLMIGDILAFIQYVQQFSQPMTQTAQISNVIQGTVAAAERVFILLDETEQSEDPAVSHPVNTPRGEVLLNNVTFSYNPETPLIEGLNLSVKPGETVAIVGPTGAGKTTLVNLLMRFYELNSGSIAVDGTLLTDMSRSDVRSLFGMVLQDAWLFSGTIRENIAYGRSGATNEDIEAAATVALADHFIRTLPQGYDTMLTEDAGNISSGQRQLLTIARAVLANSPILILDEATSSVDTRTERLIQQAMVRLAQGRTTFVIAHRLSTIRDADMIIVMNHGSIVESGTHDELLAAKGFYSRLYESQFGEELPAA